MNKANKIAFKIHSEAAGLRLDKALALCPEVGTRTRASALIDQGLVSLEGSSIVAQLKSSQKVRVGEIFWITIEAPVSNELVPMEMALDVLFEDSDILVVNKPSGLVVHPAAGHAQDTLVNAVLYHSDDFQMKFGDNRPGVVHRLDKETSGILVMAKNDFAQENLVQQFRERSVHRIYYAVVFGTPNPPQQKVCSWLARHPSDRKRYASLIGKDRKIIRSNSETQDTGKWAVTNFAKLASAHGLSYLKVQLETGRTHQIRVHLSELGYPLVGDELYGADKKIKNIDSGLIQNQIKNLNRFLLHAAELSFHHPRTNEKLHFERPWPQEDLELIRGWSLLK